MASVVFDFFQNIKHPNPVAVVTEDFLGIIFNIFYITWFSHFWDTLFTSFCTNRTWFCTWYPTSRQEKHVSFWLLVFFRIYMYMYLHIYVFPLQKDLKIILNFSSSNRNKLSVSEVLMMPTQKINYLPKSGKETHFFSA